MEIDAKKLLARAEAYVRAATTFGIKVTQSDLACVELVRRLVAAEEEVERLRKPAQEAQS